MAALPAMSPDLCDRNALDAERAQCLAHLLELERLDDGNHKFHAEPPSLCFNHVKQEACQPHQEV